MKIILLFHIKTDSQMIDRYIFERKFRRKWTNKVILFCGKIFVFTRIRFKYLTRWTNNKKTTDTKNTHAWRRTLLTITVCIGMRLFGISKKEKKNQITVKHFAPMKCNSHHVWHHPPLLHILDENSVFAEIKWKKNTHKIQCICVSFPF